MALVFPRRSLPRPAREMAYSTCSNDSAASMVIATSTPAPKTELGLCLSFLSCLIVKTHDLMKKKSVLLIEDDERLRLRLVNILNSASDIECRWAFASA